MSLETAKRFSSLGSNLPLILRLQVSMVLAMVLAFRWLVQILKRVGLYQFMHILMLQRFLLFWMVKSLLDLFHQTTLCTKNLWSKGTFSLFLKVYIITHSMKVIYHISFGFAFLLMLFPLQNNYGISSFFATWKYIYTLLDSIFYKNAIIHLYKHYKTYIFTFTHRHTHRERI